MPVELVDIAVLTYFPELLEAQGGDEGANSNTLRLFRALRLIRMMRLLRLLKLAKLQQYVAIVEDVLNANLQLLQIVKMLAGVLYLAHLLGCFWFMVGTSSGGPDHQHTWVVRYDRWTNGHYTEVSVWEQYLTSIYWALTTLTTVGYGDITPVNDTERGCANPGRPPMLA